jgi:aspartyl aminopeptidase
VPGKYRGRVNALDKNAVNRDLLAFLKDSPTPFHAAHEAARRLDAAGFTKLDERDAWEALAPGKYYVSNTGTNLLAFVKPEQVRSYRIVGAHTDSPNLRLKPKPEYVSEGYRQLGVEVYGGALLNSWLDRDLGIAGRFLVREPDGALGHRLVNVTRPLLRVAQLAVHLDRDVNDKGLVLNRQEHLAPIWGLAGGANESRGLIALLAKEASIDAATVVGSELMLFDLTAPTLAGQDEELLFSARLDNLAMCHAALLGLVHASAGDVTSGVAPLIALFDHEEVGSQSASGAESAFLPRVMERLCPSREAFLRACAGSTCISADMAHAVHPNYPGRHEPRHKPNLNGGPVIKSNAQQRYATSGETAAFFAELCRAEDVPVQYYAHRTDLPCGSTIGPITSTLLGIPTVDVGNPMLSMHSAREMCGSEDPARMTRVLGRYLRGG